VESHDHAIRLKAEIMVDHFHEQVLAPGKIGGQARAMVVTSGIERAIQYFHAFKAYLVERKSPYQAIVAFSGEHEYGEAKLSETSLNGFSSGDIADKVKTDPYRFLICADKFQTGYDEPLLHTMYVDKPLSGIKAVQTLSRLNRAHPQKHDCFVLDFQNNSEAITFAFQDYYRTTLLAEETDPNKLHDLKAALDDAQVYTPDQVQRFVELFLAGVDRDKLDPILDTCVVVYKDTLDEDGQVDFKGKAKVFCRTYSFLSSVIPYSNVEWEKLSILLNLLTPKLPAPKEEDLSKGILEAIDMDSYRVEKNAVMKIALADEDAEIQPVPTDGGGHKAEPELDRLSNILKIFNEQFGTLFSDTDRVAKRIREDIAPKVAADSAYQNAKENTPHTARMAHDQALGKVMQSLLKDDTQVYKQFVENESFRRFVTDMVYGLTSGAQVQQSASPAVPTAKASDPALATQLTSSADPLDRVGAELLALLALQRRIGLDHAVAAAARAGLTKADALSALERLARPTVSSLRRYFVDRSVAPARLVEPEEVRRRLLEPEVERVPWTSRVEVVWATNDADALDAGGSS
jgi:type I restriction enzyme R subunit